MTKVYQIDEIRNIALLGHSGSGKTSLAEAMLFNSGAINRLGKVEEGNTVADYDEEEINRTISINTAVVPVEWKGHKINVIDTPGYLDFVGEVISSLTAANVAVLVLDGVSGVEVGTILTWRLVDQRNLPRAIFINKMERDNAGYRRVLDELRGKFEATFVPMSLPIRDGERFKGVVDLGTLKGYTGAGEKPSDPPEDMADALEEFRLELVEAAAEGDDELMMKYFEGEELTDEDIAFGLRQGIKTGRVVPVFCGSATGNIGVRAFMDIIVSTLPSPDQEVTVIKDDEEVSLALKPDGPTVLQIFKTLDDQYGTVSYFKVLSGTAKSDTRLFNPVSETEERLGQLFLPRGKEQLPIDMVVAGDIGAVVKLSATKTGDPLGHKKDNYKAAPVKYPNPLYTVAVHPKTQSDTGKLTPVVQRMTAADPTLNARTEPKTRQYLLEGMGETHINVTVKRMAEKYGLNIDTAIPKVPYQETITKIAKARYRHKKQTGGAGQFGEVELRLEPLERGSDFEFTSEIFGGAISSSYLPSVEKGIKQVMVQGILAGSPIVDLKAVAVDGKEHPVDSKDIAFQIAGRECFKKAFMEAAPVLLEPIMEIKVTVPETYTGDVMGDLTTKRGQVQGMEQVKGGDTIITALVPLAEIQRYGTDLRSITQGRGIYEQKLSHYQSVPTHLAQNIMEAYKKEQEES
jgi:elongation factor G